MIPTVLAPALGSGTAFNLRGAWQANTAYAVGDVVLQAGSSYATKVAFTSGSTFDATKFVPLALAGAKGDPGGSGTSLPGVSVVGSDLKILVPTGLTWSTPPTFVTSGQKLGSGALSAGAGSLSFAIPGTPTGSPNDMSTFHGGVFLQMPAPGGSPFTASGPFLKFTDSHNQVWGFIVIGGQLKLVYGGNNDLSGTYADGTFHFLGFSFPAAFSGRQYNQVWLDQGSLTNVFNDTAGDRYLRAGTVKLDLDMAQLPTGSLVQMLCIYTGDTNTAIPTDVLTRTSDALVVLNLTNNGDNLASDGGLLQIGPMLAGPGLALGADGKTLSTTGLNYRLRGAWVANTAYAAGDVVTQAGSSWVAPTAFTSGSAFNAANWMLQAAKGDPGSGGGAGLPGVSVSGKSLVLASASAVTWTSTPTFVTTGQKFGTGALAGGVGTLPFVIPVGSDGNNNCSIQFFLKVSTASFTGSDFLWISDSAGRTFGVRRTGTTLSSDHAGSLIDLGYVVADGAVYHHYHWFIVGTPGGNHYSVWHRDGGGDGGNSDNGSTPGLQAGAALLHIDADHGLAAGDLLDAVVLSTSSDATPPTSAPVVTSATLALLNFDGDGVDAANTVTTTIGPMIAGPGLALGSDGKTLSVPNIAPTKLWFKPGVDGNTGSALNAAIADAKRLNTDQLYVYPGLIIADQPVRPGERFNLIGMGVHEPDQYSFTGGGVTIQMPLNSQTGCIEIIGSKPNPSTADGFINKTRVENFACTGATQPGVVTRPGGPARLVKVINAYSPELHAISVHNDFHGGFYFENVWDWYCTYLRANACGFSDPHATTDNATIQSYTGRSFTAIENRLGRSLGVPMMEIVSPNTNGGGQDTTNNLRLDNFHFEGNAENAVGIMIRGGNCNMIKLTGGKVELTQGNVPLIVADDISGLRLECWIHGVGNGYPFGSYAGVTYGEAWSAFTNPGLVILGGACLMPIADLTMGYVKGGSPLQAYVRALGAEYPIIQACIVDGTGALTPPGAARIILDACGPVSAARVNAYVQKYVVNRDGGGTEILAINGTTMIA